jgi:DNA-binding winged helix-turn-helix (wHTH) protein/TolB-like protein/Flp pilus assembly protein TadD
VIEQGKNGISFADFELDKAHRRLMRAGNVLPINSKAFDLLEFLAENAGRTVSKEELLAAVWPDQFVEEANLSVQISTLRKVLDDRKDSPLYLLTVPGKGYRFVADVRKTREIEHYGEERAGSEEEIGDEASGPQAKALRFRSRTVIFALLGLVAGSLIAWVGYEKYSSTPLPVPIRSIAVLPFIFQDPVADSEYLSEGLAESVIHSLSRYSELRIMSRNSAFGFKSPSPDVVSIGRQLGVEAVLTGRIKQTGEAFLISTELISAADNSVLWGEQFTRRLSDMERLQTDIVRSIAQKLQLSLNGTQRIESAPADSEVYRLCLLGRYHLSRLTDEDYYKAQDYFQQAINRDDAYAPAYAGLAETYSRLSSFNVVPPSEGFQKARPLATKALELDDQLAEAHAVLGTINHFYDWDWLGAEREFKRALVIDPNNSDTRVLYGYHLISMLRFDEALGEMKRAHELDPLSLGKIVGVGDAYYLQRRFDPAMEQYRRAIDMDPNSGFGRWSLGNAYLIKGMYKEAAEEYQKSIPLSGDSPDESAALALAYARSGRRKEALVILDYLKERSKSKYVPPSVIAFVYAGLGEKDEAFEWLERSYAGRDFLMGFINVEPYFDGLRDDPRFNDLRQRVGLPHYPHK